MFSATKGGSTAGYQISRSVRLRSSASATFSRTPASAGSTTKGTFSFWIKRGTLSTAQQIYHVAGTSGNNSRFFLAYNVTTDTFSIVGYSSAGAVALELVTTQVFRDPSSWYHIVIYIDTTQASSSNRVILYINGAQVSSFGTSTIPAQNTALGFTNNTASLIGANQGSTNFFDGYLTEINFIDGQALTPSSFGQTNYITGVWSPIKYTGTYGTNGFYLNFSDNSGATATTIGKDFSGNGNNWTPNNISVTAGVTYDSMLDVPTQWADGGNGRGNYAVLNPLSFYAGGGSGTVSDGNLKVALTNQRAHHGTMALLSSKWYWEAKLTSASINSTGAGIVTDAQAASNTSPYNGWVFDVQAGRNYYNGSFTTLSGGAFATGDTISIAVDLDSGKIWYAKNGTWLGTSADPAAGTGAAQTNVSGSVLPVFFEMNSGFSATWEANFGQRPFTYTPPTGFRALNTLNLPTPTILKGNQYMDATLYTGTGASQSITNSGSMQPDFVWIKGRNAAWNNVLRDSVRGADKFLYSNSTAAESTAGSGYSFDSNGFSIGTSGEVNTNTNTYVGWQWRAGVSAVTNTSGSITSTVDAGTTQGFSIATYTGNGTGGATIGHGLGVSPAMIFIKSRNNATNWMVWHQNLAANFAFEGLNTTGAAVSGGSPSKYVRSVSSTLVTIGNDLSVNQSASYTYVMYCFAQIAGFSSFGSYTGNGSTDGPFCFTGFLPRWLMIKESSGTSNWSIIDTARDNFNVADNPLLANSSAAETTSTSGSGAFLDVLSNGFKLRGNSGDVNDNAATYIFAAFAENPFKNALAR